MISPSSNFSFIQCEVAPKGVLSFNAQKVECLPRLNGKKAGWRFTPPMISLLRILLSILRSYIESKGFLLILSATPIINLSTILRDL